MSWRLPGESRSTDVVDHTVIIARGWYRSLDEAWHDLWLKERADTSPTAGNFSVKDSARLVAQTDEPLPKETLRTAGEALRLMADGADPFASVPDEVECGGCRWGLIDVEVPDSHIDPNGRTAKVRERHAACNGTGRRSPNATERAFAEKRADMYHQALLDVGLFGPARASAAALYGAPDGPVIAIMTRDLIWFGATCERWSHSWPSAR
jgi:hypothetical protein